MRKLYINGKFLTQSQTGVQRFAREILAALDEIVPSGKSILVCPRGAWTIPQYKNIKIERVGFFSGIMWEQIIFPLYVILKRGNCLNLCNVAPLLSPGFSTIHDLKIMSHPLFFSWKFRIWYKILFANQTKRCCSIFTVSEQVKTELLSYYPMLNANNIYVASCAWQHYLRVCYDSHALSKYELQKGQYYFSLSSLEPNKNFKWVAEVAKRNPNGIFVVAGSINSKIFADGLGFECPPNMKLLGFVSDEDAKTLMRDAKAFLFPSFCEGFGMPPLEALSAGVPKIIVSDIPVMHEIFDNNAIYINPYQYDYNLDELMREATCNAEKVLEKYSWENSAHIIYDVLMK